MKILFISMPSVHVIRWIENLEDTNHQLYWFDVLGRGELETTKNVVQITNWQKRKLPNLKGEYFLRKKFPNVYQVLQPFLEITANEALEKIILTIQPDVVHSFEMQVCSYPIFKTMQKFRSLKWIYSCWGSDLFYYQQFSSHLQKIKHVLKRVNFLHTDCKRDFVIAQKLNFAGKHVGIIPGGTGYKLEELERYKRPIKNRKIIIVKGYEHNLGRGLNVVKALQLIQNEIQNYEIVVFGAHKSVIDFVESNQLDFVIYDRKGLSHKELLQLMGKSLIYIGNSISDGIPNTLLEAIAMGAFPIQSNPGGASEEIIDNTKNGLLIEDPANISAIKEVILEAISNQEMLHSAFELNAVIAQKRLDYYDNKAKVISIYENLV